MGCCTERVKSEAVTEVNLGADGGANIYAKTEGEESYRDTIASSLQDEKPEKRSPKNKAELEKETEEEEAPAATSDDSWDDDEDWDDDAATTGAPVNGAPEPIVIAERPGEVRTLTVGMASLELDAADSPFLMFRNAASGGINIVYRRPDGHIGWIDPARAERTEPA